MKIFKKIRLEIVHSEVQSVWKLVIQFDCMRWNGIEDMANQTAIIDWQYSVEWRHKTGGNEQFWPFFVNFRQLMNSLNEN